MSDAKRTGSVFIVSAPSGCGKTTIVSAVVKKISGLKRSVSATTRRPRSGEKNGRDYYFISEKSFRMKAEKGDFIEWANNFGSYYGTPKKPLTAVLRAGHDVILTIDVKGAAQVKKRMPGSVMVFILPPGRGDLEKRLGMRGSDAKKEMRKRLNIAKKEMAYAKRYDYVIVNDILTEAVEQLRAVIIAKRCETKRNVR
ncbi:MAG: guanylate kinase [Candidatus Omnitrophota bacterium]